MPHSSSTCAACDATLTGAFCAACGARAPQPGDERLGRFLREQYGEVTSADGKLWRTVRALFVPGKLTDEYFSGRRSLYLRPVRVFLVINIVFFFVLSGAGGSAFRGPLDSQRGASLYGGIATQLAAEQRTAWDSDADYERAFNQKADTLAPTLIGVFVPLLAGLLAIAFWPVRAAGVRHLVLATHTVAWMMASLIGVLLLAFLLLSMAQLLGYSGVLNQSLDPAIVPAVVLAALVYLAASFRRVYGVSWIYAGIAGLGITTLGMMMLMLVFRAVLFFATWATLRPIT